MRSCTRCSLAEGRRNVVVYRGSPSPWVVFLGEAPGAKEDELGRPFVGRAGRLLDAAIETLAIPEDSYGITNVIMCRPPGNVFDPEAARACRPWLDLKLELLSPKIVVTLGSSALHALDPAAGPLARLSGETREWSGGTLFPLLHPAATFHRRAYREQWDRDVARLKDLLPQWIPAGTKGDPAGALLTPV